MASKKKGAGHPPTSLADRRHVNQGNVRQVNGAEVYKVKADGGGSWYTVIRWPTSPEPSWECRCQAGQHGVPCKHIRRARYLRSKNAGSPE
jgi:hypothetical protein